MTLLTQLIKDPAPGVALLDTAPVTPPAPGTQLIASLQWNNLIDLLQGTSVDEIDRDALEVMTANRAAISNATGHLDVSVVTDAELAFLQGASSNIQAQLNAHQTLWDNLNTSTRTWTNKTIDSFTNVNHADTVHLQVRNETGLTLTKGSLVYINGFDVGSDLPTVALANASAAATMPVVGVISNDIATAANGDITVTGQLSGIVTTGFGNGDVLYASSTPGAFTNVRPTGTNLVQIIGSVLKVGGAGVGTIKVSIMDRIADLPNLPQNNVWIGDAAALPVAGLIANANVDAAAAIAYSKLNLTASIVNADIDAAAAIAYSKLNLASSIVNGDLAGGAYGAITGLGTLTSNLVIGNAAVVMDTEITSPPANSSWWFGHEFGVMWFNAPTGNQIDFAINGSSKFTVKNNRLDLHNNTDILGALNIQFGNSATVPSSFLRYIQYATADFWINAAAADTTHIQFDAGAAADYSFNATRANFNAKDATSLLELEADHAIPAANQVIGRIQFYDDDDLGARRLYAEIVSEIEDPGNAAPDGSLFLDVLEGGGTPTYIALNNGALNKIDFLRPLNMGGNAIEQISNSPGLSFQSGESITAGGTFLTLKVGAGDFVVFNVNSVNEYFFSATEVDFQGNNITDVGHIEFLNDTAGPSANRTFIENINNVLRFNVDAAESFLFTQNGVNKFSIGSAILNYNAQNATAILELEANHTIPANGNVIGDLTYYDDDSVGGRVPYARIQGVIEDPTTTQVDGELLLQAAIAGTLTTMITLNAANSGDVLFSADADLNSNNLLNVGTLNTHTVPGGTSTLALLSNNLGAFAATTSAQLLGVMSDETGSGLLVFATNPTLSGFTMADATDIVLNATTGTKIGTATTQKLGFYNAAPVVQPTALTAALTTVTSVGPGTPDYALAAATSGGWGFSTADEFETIMTVIINNQLRINQLESKLQSLGLLA